MYREDGHAQNVAPGTWGLEGVCGVLIGFIEMEISSNIIDKDSIFGYQLFFSRTKCLPHFENASLSLMSVGCLWWLFLFHIGLSICDFLMQPHIAVSHTPIMS